MFHVLTIGNEDTITISHVLTIRNEETVSIFHVLTIGNEDTDERHRESHNEDCRQLKLEKLRQGDIRFYKFLKMHLHN